MVPMLAQAIAPTPDSFKPRYVNWRGWGGKACEDTEVNEPAFLLLSKITNSVEAVEGDTKTGQRRVRKPCRTGGRLNDSMQMANTSRIVQGTSCVESSTAALVQTQ